MGYYRMIDYFVITFEILKNMHHHCCDHKSIPHSNTDSFYYVLLNSLVLFQKTSLYQFYTNVWYLYNNFAPNTKKMHSVK